MVKERYTIPDLLRGFAIVSMVAYHALWDLVYIFDVSIPWFGSEGAKIWQLSIRWVFLLISGFCWSMGGKKAKRGLLVLACSAVISLVTVAIMPDSLILFGVLSLIGAGMLVLIPLDKAFRQISPYVGIVAALVLFLLTKDTAVGEVGPWNLPNWLYANDLTAWLGFPRADFFSTDYVPLIPWLFVYAMGYFTYRLFEKQDWLKHLSAFRFRPLEWLGRHSLTVYMLHQPLVYGILYLIFA